MAHYITKKITKPRDEENQLYWEKDLNIITLLANIHANINIISKVRMIYILQKISIQ